MPRRMRRDPFIMRETGESILWGSQNMEEDIVGSEDRLKRQIDNRS
jgi:hypothetical protein